MIHDSTIPDDVSLNGDLYVWNAADRPNVRADQLARLLSLVAALAEVTCVPVSPFSWVFNQARYNTIHDLRSRNVEVTFTDECQLLVHQFDRYYERARKTHSRPWAL